MLNLLEMPDVAMNIMLEKLDYIDLQRLRKTCWTIRNFIDDSKLDSFLTRIDIWISDYINFGFKFGDDDQKIQIQYKRIKNGSEIVIYENYKKRQKILENQDFVDLAFLDLQSVLVFQKSVPHFLNIDFCSKSGCSNIPERFQKIFKFRKIKTKTFRTTVTRESEILSILPFLDSTHLKSLIIFNDQGDGTQLDTSEIVESEQWKNLETLTVRNFVVDIPIRKLNHLKRIYVAVTEITMDMVLELKEAFLTSESLQEFKIDFDSQKIDQNLAELFGVPFTDHDGFGQERKKWFFQIPNSENRVLLISLNLYCIIFYRNWTENVPENVVMN
ncbi:hypothetical protein B9Z55_004534 [Caenorhabditis nigoni]|uniref:F-box domain-containing protein n=1 Tax=Caenorhabditis nigoni TaxID=1611254 RepID=A0A2G5UX02_9PELO|nr:hypothetical protein B9Z55_004534 [Caenorhabditis nigoni]